MNLLGELRRRNVLRAGVLYVGAAWALAQGIAQLTPVVGAPEWVARWFLVAAAIGFPFWIAFAWFYELTPQGLKRESAIAADASIVRGSTRKLDRAIIAVLAVAVVLLITNQLVLHRDAGGRAESADTNAIGATLANVPAKSIAVLPFENLSADKSNAFFADGIQDEILTGLARISDMKVISRTSTERYASHPDNLRRIAATLGVATILEGSVQKSGNEVLINVQLIDARTGYHLWAQSYPRTLDDVFRVEGEVARKVADSLRAVITRDERAALDARPTSNPAAYTAYLRALALSHRVSYTDTAAVQQTIAAYQQAVTIDPGFALAWAGIVKWNAWLFWEGNDPDGSHLAAAKGAMDRALALAPELPQVELARAWYLYYGTGDFRAALESFQQAQQGLPNDAQVWQGTGLVERRLGNWDAAIAALEHARRLSPEDLGLAYDLADSLAALRRFGDAEMVVDGGLKLDPNDSELRDLKALCLWNGDHGRAEIERGLDAAPPSPIAIGNRARQALYERRYTEAAGMFRRAMAGSGDLRSSNSFQDYLDVAIDYRLQRALAEARNGSPAEARDLYRQVLDETRARLAAHPANPHTAAALNAAAGLAAAGLGQRDDAVKYGLRATALVPAAADAVDGRQWQVYLAMIYAQNRDTRNALPLIHHLLVATYSHPLTTRILRVDPVWDPIRDDPGFRVLLENADHAQIATGGGAGHG